MNYNAPNSANFGPIYDYEVHNFSSEFRRSEEFFHISGGNPAWRRRTDYIYQLIQPVAEELTMEYCNISREQFEFPALLMGPRYVELMDANGLEEQKATFSSIVGENISNQINDGEIEGYIHDLMMSEVEISEAIKRHYLHFFNVIWYSEGDNNYSASQSRWTKQMSTTR
jgi:hypothetical protein